MLAHRTLGNLVGWPLLSIVEFPFSELNVFVPFLGVHMLSDVGLASLEDLQNAGVFFVANHQLVVGVPE
jgi:hypothetical protein